MFDFRGLSPKECVKLAAIDSIRLSDRIKRSTFKRRLELNFS
jgi:hypothetical protein